MASLCSRFIHILKGMWELWQSLRLRFIRTCLPLSWDQPSYPLASPSPGVRIYLCHHACHLGDHRA